MSAIRPFWRASVTCARAWSVLKSRNSGCESAAWTCAVPGGLKFESELLAFDLIEFQPSAYEPPPTGRRWPRPTLPDQRSVRTPSLPKKTLLGGACWTLRLKPLVSVGRNAADACA